MTRAIYSKDRYNYCEAGKALHVYVLVFTPKKKRWDTGLSYLSL